MDEDKNKKKSFLLNWCITGITFVDHDIKLNVSGRLNGAKSTFTIPSELRADLMTWK